MNPKVGERYKVTYTEDDWFIYEVVSVHDDEYGIRLRYKVLEAGSFSPYSYAEDPLLSNMWNNSSNWNSSEPLNYTINRRKLNKQVSELLK